MGIERLAKARDRLLAADAAELLASQVCSALVEGLHDVVSFSACAVMTTDPSTLLPSGGVVEGFATADCVPFWDNELIDPDFNKFAELARRIDPVATLADATDGDLARSPRYTKLFHPAGLADEMRAVFVAGSSCLAVATLVRPVGEGCFDDSDVGAVRALVPVATAVLRRAQARVRDVTPQPPVVILLDADGRVAGISHGGEATLDDLRINVDGEFPGIVHAAAAKARWSRSDTPLTTRLQGRSGRWLRLHVAPMTGDGGMIAVTVESARPGDLAEVLLDSYGLTARETEIVLALCRGTATKGIADELCLSVHTVRDHLKAIYVKTGVTSRGELVADLFTTYVLDGFHHSVTHVASATADT